MGRKTDAWMPLYIGDYLRDTMHLTTAQHGAYMLLIMTAWTRGGSLPTDEKFLAGTVKMSLDQWRKNWPSLRDFFREANGTLVQGRVLQEVEKSRKISEVRAQAGYKGGSKPKANASQTADKSQGMITPSPPPSEVPSPKKEGGLHPPKKEPRPKVARGERISPDWQPSEDDIAFAIANGLDGHQLQREIDGFRNYWLSRSRDAARLDWSRTWKVRVGDVAGRSEALAARQKTNGGGSGVTDFASILAERRASAQGGTPVSGQRGLAVGTSDLFGD